MDRYNLSAVEQQIRGQFFKPDDPDALGKMGMLATAFLVTYMLTAPLFGWLADRTRRWVIIGIGVTLWSLATGACGLSTTFTALLLCRVLVGVGEGAWGPTAPTLIADMYPVSRRGAVLAWFNIALSVGSALGFMVGGAVAAWKGWPWAFFVLAPPGLLLGILSFTRKEPQRGASDAGGASRRFRVSDVRVLIRTPSYILNTLGMAAQTFGVGGMSFWMVTYIHEMRLHGHVGDADFEAVHSHVNFVFGAITASMGLVGTLVGGYLADWLRTRVKGAYFTLSGVSMLLAVPAFVGVLLLPLPLAWWAMGAAIFFIFVNTGPTNTVIANVTPAPVRATAFALNILIIHLFGDAVSPPVIGAISDHFGKTEMLPDPATGAMVAHRVANMNAGFAVVGLAMALAGLFWLIGARYLDRDTEIAPTRLAP